MKKTQIKAIVISLLLVVIMVVTCACTATVTEPTEVVEATEVEVSQETSTESSKGTDSESMKIGDYEFTFDKSIPVEDREFVMVYSNAASQFGALVKAGVDQAAADYGINAYMQGGTEWGPDEEIQIMENVIAKGVDGIGVGVLDVEALTPYIQQALEAGIPVVCYNGDAPDSGRLGYAGADYVAQGYYAAKNILDAIAVKYPEGGKILCTGTYLADTIQQARNTGLTNAIEEYSDMKIELVYQDCPGDDTAVYSALENLYLANQDAVGWVDFGNTGILLSRVLEDYEAGNANSDNPIFNASADIYEERVQQVLDGWATSVWSQDPFNQGYLPVEMLYQFFTTWDPACFQVKSTEVWGVTMDNAKDILDQIVLGDPIG